MGIQNLQTSLESDRRGSCHRWAEPQHSQSNDPVKARRTALHWWIKWAQLGIAISRVITTTGTQMVIASSGESKSVRHLCLAARSMHHAGDAVRHYGPSRLERL